MAHSVSLTIDNGIRVGVNIDNHHAWNYHPETEKNRSKLIITFSGNRVVLFVGDSADKIHDYLELGCANLDLTDDE